MRYQLPVPGEPVTLRTDARQFIERSPSDTLGRIETGELIVDALWPLWQEPLQKSGIDQDQFQRIVAGYQNEVRLWVMGERPWSHCVEGLIGRVERRITAAPSGHSRGRSAERNLDASDS